MTVSLGSSLASEGICLFVGLWETKNEIQSSGGVWKSRWTSWGPVPNKPTVSVDVKQHLNQPTQNEIVVSWITLWGMMKVYWLDLTWL